jgi:hypothetical protein
MRSSDSGVQGHGRKSMKRPPEWFGKPYASYDANSWDEALRQCRSVLVRWAGANQTGTYSDLIKEITAIPWPEGAYTHQGSQVGKVLGEVSIAEWLENRPLLSAVAVHVDDGIPGKGFFDMCKDLGVLMSDSEEERLRVWLREFQDCCMYAWPDPDQ